MSGTTIIFDSKFNSFYCVNGPNVEIVSLPGHNRHRSAVMRVVREILTSQARRTESAVELHAAAFEVDGIAIVVAGPKGAGKTTALCRAMGEGASLLTNDWLFVRSDGDILWAHAVPTAVSVRPETQRMFPALYLANPATGSSSRLTVDEARWALAQEGPSDGKQKLTLTAAQLIDRLGTSAVDCARLGSIILYDNSAPGSVRSELDRPSEELLRGCLYGSGTVGSRDTIFGTLTGAQVEKSGRNGGRALLKRLSDQVLGVDPGLAALLASLDARVVRTTAITARPGRFSSRASYRISLDDGRTIKGRRARPATAEPQAWKIVRGLSDDRFSTVLAGRGDYVLEEWVEGTPLDTVPLSRAYLDEAADILGRLHTITSFDGRSLLRPVATVDALTKLEADLERLVDCGTISQRHASTLIELAARWAPQMANVGVTHNDFCPENLVVDAFGRLRVIDNEAMALWFLDYDFDRTKCRWHMDEGDWQVFVRRYARYRADLPSPVCFKFWCLAATARSARVRTMNELDGAGEVLSKMMEFLNVDVDEPEETARAKIESAGS